jgi:hypothetical protein
MDRARFKVERAPISAKRIGGQKQDGVFRQW